MLLLLNWEVMSIFFIAAMGLLFLFLFFRGLATASTRLLSDVLKGTSVTLLVIAFILFILSGRILPATLLLGIGGTSFLFYRRRWGRKSRSPALLTRPLTLEEALMALGFVRGEDLSLERIESAYQSKIRALPRQGKRPREEERAHLNQARDLLVHLVRLKK